MDKKFEELEQQIDQWLVDILDKSSIPRNKYIYHCNLAFIDIVVDQKLLFSMFEKDYLFSLSYNTYIAHMKLKEEEVFDYKFDKKIYLFAIQMILKGMQYSLLCNIFPLLHAGKAEMRIERNNNIFFDTKDIPRKNYKFIDDYSIRKALSYTLQMVNGKFKDEDDEEIAMKLSDHYLEFWNENMMYDDFEPYTRLDWGGISFFFILASMRRFNKLYKQDFDIVSFDSQKMMILLSPNGLKRLREYVPSTDDKMFDAALDDNIYKPIGNNMFPKLSISDAPLNMTCDGYIYANPLVILFNNSSETKFLNYLRKADNRRYLRIKDKVKERVIPLITEMINYKFPTAKAIPNFYVKIPNCKKNKRECDLLIVDSSGFAIYLEIKHFYYPQSFREVKNVDSELLKALKKMPDQLAAIRENWEILKMTYGIASNLKSLEGVVVSHHYTGYDLEINPDTPIVSTSTLYESIADAQSIQDIYSGCKEIDAIYPNLQFIKQDLKFDFCGYNFNVEVECLDQLFEVEFIKAYRKLISKSVTSNKPKIFDNIPDLAKAYLGEMKK